MTMRGILHFALFVRSFCFTFAAGGVIVGVGLCFYGQNGLSLHMVPQFEELHQRDFFCHA